MAEVAEPLRLKLIPSERKDDEITVCGFDHMYTKPFFQFS